jgi:hypothetical protein
MSKPAKPDATAAREGFERQDLSPRSVSAFLAGLGLLCVLVSFVLKGMYSYLDAYDRSHQPPLSPLKPPAATDTRAVPPAEIMKFPEPRLESNERTELGEFRLQEERTLNSYGWVDEKAGTLRIPIERAMQLVAERGLPVRPQGEVSGAAGKTRGPNRPQKP